MARGRGGWRTSSGKMSGHLERARPVAASFVALPTFDVELQGWEVDRVDIFTEAAALASAKLLTWSTLEA